MKKLFLLGAMVCALGMFSACKSSIKLIELIEQQGQVRYKNTGYEMVTAAEDGYRGRVNTVTERFYSVTTADTAALHVLHHSYNEAGYRQHYELGSQQMLQTSDYEYADGRLVGIEEMYTQYLSPMVMRSSYEKSNPTHIHYTHAPNGFPATMVREMVSGDGDSIRTTLIFTCDTQGRVLEEHGDPLNKIYTYDTEGRTVSVVTVGMSSGSNEYDAQGRLSKSHLTMGGESGTYTISYNNHGDPSDIILTVNNKDQGFHYDYTYDTHGNWLTRNDGNLLIRRTITYYKE